MNTHTHGRKIIQIIPGGGFYAVFEKSASEDDQIELMTTPVICFALTEIENKQEIVGFVPVEMYEIGVASDHDEFVTFIARDEDVNSDYIKDGAEWIQEFKFWMRSEREEDERLERQKGKDNAH